jgi:hypothetical protein
LFRYQLLKGRGHPQQHADQNGPKQHAPKRVADRVEQQFQAAIGCSFAPAHWIARAPLRIEHYIVFTDQIESHVKPTRVDGVA